MRGPRGTGLTRQQIIDTFARRLQNHPDFELQESLRNIHRVVETEAQRQVRRQRPRWATTSGTGTKPWSQYSDPGYVEEGQLTVTYLTDAHRACAA